MCKCRYFVCWINMLNKNNGDKSFLLTCDFVRDTFENVWRTSLLSNFFILKTILNLKIFEYLLDAYKHLKLKIVVLK